MKENQTEPQNMKMNQIQPLTGLLAVAIMVHRFGILCLAAEPLHEGWWQDSAEVVLKQAQSTTLKVDFLHTSKARLQDDPQRGFELFQRRTPEGNVETKIVSKRGSRVQSAAYSLNDGKYFDADGLLRKIGYEEGPEIESRIAGSLPHPYEYQSLKSDFIGTSDCIIVRRTAGKPLFDAMAAEIYRDEKPEKRTMLAAKYLRAMTDFYIRKSDGIIAGYCKRNISGNTLLEDKVPDQVSIGGVIPTQEFYLSRKDSALIVTNVNEATAVMIAQKAKNANVLNEDTKEAKSKRLKVQLVLGCLALVLPIALLLRWLKGGRRLGAENGSSVSNKKTNEKSK
jgi:hypothetical protein